MLSSLTIKRFRCFPNLKIGSSSDPLPRFNLILGKNNTGKTAILEAVFLLLGPGNPESAMRIRSFRGFPSNSGSPTEAWGWLFFGHQFDAEAEISATFNKARAETLRIRMASPTTPIRVDQSENSDVGSSTDMSSTESMNRELQFDYRPATGSSTIARALFTPGKIMQFEPAKSTTKRLGIFLNSRIWNSQEDVMRFSQLAQEPDRLAIIVDALRVVEPKLKRLELLVANGVTSIHADIGLRRLIPSQMLGDGALRLLRLLLAIASAPGATLLIDEIENGFHYSTLHTAWKFLAAVARKSNVQVFATTHSRECVAAAHEAFTENDTDDLHVHRLERRESGEIIAVTMDREALATSLELEWEVR
jgi:hypothetical protein